MRVNLLGRYSSYLFLVRANCCSSNGSELRKTRSKVIAEAIIRDSINSRCRLFVGLT